MLPYLIPFKLRWMDLEQDLFESWWHPIKTTLNIEKMVGGLINLTITEYNTHFGRGHYEYSQREHDVPLGNSYNCLIPMVFSLFPSLIHDTWSYTKSYSQSWSFTFPITCMEEKIIFMIWWLNLWWILWHFYSLLVNAPFPQLESCIGMENIFLVSEFYWIPLSSNKLRTSGSFSLASIYGRTSSCKLWLR